MIQDSVWARKRKGVQNSTLPPPHGITFRMTGPSCSLDIGLRLLPPAGAPRLGPCSPPAGAGHAVCPPAGTEADALVFHHLGDRTQI